MAYATLAELMDAIARIQTDNPTLKAEEIRLKQEAVANEHCHLIPNDLPTLLDLFDHEFINGQQEYSGAFLNIVRKRGCELLIAQMDKTTSKEKLKLALQHTEFFIWSDGHFFLETLKRLDQPARYSFVLAVFNLPSATKELESVKDLWRIIFLLESVPFLPKEHQKTFIDLLDAKLSSVRFGTDNLGTLIRGAHFSWPSPSPEFLIGALYLVDADKRLEFAKKILTNPSSDYRLYKKPSIDVLVKILFALPTEEDHQAFIAYFLQTIPLLQEELKALCQTTISQITHILFGNIQTQEIVEQTQCTTVLQAFIQAIPLLRSQKSIQTPAAIQDVPIQSISAALTLCDNEMVYPLLSLNGIMDSQNATSRFSNKPLQELLHNMMEACQILQNTTHEDYDLAKTDAPKIFRALIDKINWNDFELIQAILRNDRHNPAQQWDLEFVRFLSIKAADLYLSRLSFIEDPEAKVQFAARHANVLIWTDTSFFLKAVSFLPIEKRLEFILYTFDLGLNEIKECTDPWSIVGVLNVLADLPEAEQQCAIKSFTEKIPKIKWDELITQAIQNQKIPKTPNPLYLTGMLYLCHVKDRLALAQLILHASPENALSEVFHKKPSIEFLKTVLKALSPQDHMAYIQYFHNTMDATLTAWEEAEIQKLLNPAAELPNPAPRIVPEPAPKPAPVIPTPPAPLITPESTSKITKHQEQDKKQQLFDILSKTVSDYIQERKTSWKYRWSNIDPTVHTKIPLFIRKLFNALFTRYKKVSAVEAQFNTFSPENNSCQDFLKPMLTFNVAIKGYRAGLLEQKLKQEVGKVAYTRV